MSAIEACRSCGNKELFDFLSLGDHPLANALLTEDRRNDPEPTYPLDLTVCTDCSLVQVKETVSPEVLFRDYIYFSSFSGTMLHHARELAERVITGRSLNAASLVVDVGSNDGYLLQYYKQAGIPVLGIEPAANIARIAQEERGIATLCKFFSDTLAVQLKKDGECADVIHANNVLAHVADLNGVVRGFKMLLKETGVAICEVPYVKEMIDRREFDTIYHEHLCYFSLTALDRLFSRHKLVIYDVERLSVHGGTLRVYAGHEGRPHVPDHRSGVVAQLLQEETDWGVSDPDFYLGFEAKVEALRCELITLLRDLKLRGQRIAVYGASAKGSTLLNYFRLGRETLEFVVDRSTVKQGYYTPGTHLRIYPPEKLLEDLPEYTLLLTWNLADEILEQQAPYRRLGGRFIIPIPEVQVV
jgi:SAM-dependent methyltransferase